VQFNLAALARPDILVKASAMFFDGFERCQSSEASRQNPRPEADVGADIDRVPEILDVRKGRLELPKLVGSGTREVRPALNVWDEVFLGLWEPNAPYLFVHGIFPAWLFRSVGCEWPNNLRGP
jgi:hypothetical protein